MNETPRFRFALREDLKDDKRFLPTRATPNDTGYDVRAAPDNGKDIIIKAGSYFKIPMGFRAFCPDGWYYQLHPRSSSFIKKSLHSLIGIIDEDFFLNLSFCGQYIPDTNSLSKDIKISFGEAIGQIIPTKKRNYGNNRNKQ